MFVKFTKKSKSTAVLQLYLVLSSVRYYVFVSLTDSRHCCIGGGGGGGGGSCAGSGGGCGCGWWMDERGASVREIAEQRDHLERELLQRETHPLQG